VLANNFLIHMNDRQAAICMLNAARLGRPGGLFVCRGVAQPVREKVVQQLGFKPLACRIAEIHNADEKFAARKDWPWRYWALEPIDKSRKNWTTRYASMFQCAAALVILLTCSVIVAKERDSPTTGAVTPSEAPKLRGSRTERTLS